MKAVSRICSLICVIALLSACGSGSSSSTASTPAPSLVTFSVSGKITVEKDSDVDKDLNVDTQINNSVDDPQIIVNPSTIGGYLSGSADTYSGGTTFDIDQSDFFSAYLAEGQEINLSLFLAQTDLSDVDLTFSLRSDTSPYPVIETLSFSDISSNSFSVPESGQYIIEVSTALDTSPILYTLSLSQSLFSSTSVSSSALNADFVPGDIIVKFKDGSHIKDAETPVPDSSFRSSGSSSNASELAIDRYGLKFNKNIGDIAGVYRVDNSNLRGAFSFSKSTEQSKEILRLEKKLQTLEIISQLNEQDSVDYAEPNYLFTAAAVSNSASSDPIHPNDPQFGRQWSLPMLSLPATWGVSTGDGVVVAIIDSGIDFQHEDLDANINLTDGFDFISDLESAGDGDGPDSDPQDEGSTFHGTHVAGIVAAEGNNALGIIGVAYESNIMPLRALGVNDQGSNADIANAISYAAGLEPNSNGQFVAQKADIINMSFGTTDEPKAVKEAIDSAIQEGVIFVAAAGNESSDEKFYPAAYSNVISVSSVTDQKARSSFSNFGSTINVAAPGGTGPGDPLLDGYRDGILSTVAASNYLELAGTSMAAPHMAGVTALMKQVNPTLDQAAIMFALSSGELTQDIGSSESFGSGLINAAKAVQWAASGEVIPASLNIYPNQFGFIGANTESKLELSNPGADGVTMVNVTSEDDWVEVVPSKDENGLGVYTVRVNKLTNPIDSGQLTVNYQIDGVEQEPEILRIFVSNSEQTNASVGNVFVSLIREEDVFKGDRLTAFSTVSGKLSNGVYSFVFKGIPDGAYLLRASTDSDGDFITFDGGEAVGIYPLVSGPELIDVSNSSLFNLEFGIKYQPFVSSAGSQGVSGVSTTAIGSTVYSKAAQLDLNLE